MALAFKGEVEFYKPIIDEKYRQCTPAWWVAQIRNMWHGKHAAAIMSSTSLDEKTESSNKRIGWRQTSRRPEKSDPHNTSTGSQGMDMALVRNDE
jgi:hypothetical protein